MAEEPSLLTKEVQESFESIIKDGVVAITTLTEEKFTRIFLPVLANRFINNNDESFDIHKWISLAGGPFRPVDIVNGKGEVLFTVPPVYESSGVHSLRTRTSIFDVLSNIRRELEQNPFHADRRIRDRLFENLAIQGSNQTRFLANWAFILERYGYPVPWAKGLGGFSDTAVEGGEAKVVTDKPADDFDADTFNEV